MRLFLYYASHSLLNTLKKMMKTWVVVFVIMIAFGGMIGLFGSMLDKSSNKTDDTTIVLETAHSRYQTDIRKLYIHPTQFLRRFFYYILISRSWLSILPIDFRSSGKEGDSP